MCCADREPMGIMREATVLRWRVLSLKTMDTVFCLTGWCPLSTEGNGG